MHRHASDDPVSSALDRRRSSRRADPARHLVRLCAVPRPGDLRLGRGMTTPYVDTHIKRLAIAREAAELGARKKAVAQLSCLPYRDVARLFSRERGKVPRGVPPSSEIWASEAPLLCRVEAAIFCNLFERLRMAGHGSS